ncbi:MAG: amidophosphoribosyltransferase [Oscillospiraceae bacterium]|nr:amidophosphoribosyltransferase [Oscillospiraceae bacterium]
MCKKHCIDCDYSRDFREIHEECGVFGITTGVYDRIDVREEVRYALYALQHRGQESCGISVNDHGVITTVKDVGLVPEVLTNEALEKLPMGQMAIGHNRYGSSGSIDILDAQPLYIRHAKGTMSLAFNGQLVNAVEIRRELQQQGIIFHTSSDAEVIAYTIAKERLTSHSTEEAVRRAMEKLEGAVSMVVMSPRKLIAARDKHGFRPMVIGRLPGGGYVFASETCALEVVGAKFLRDVKPGEIVQVENGILSVYQEGVEKPDGLFIFEYVYFARPDSVVEGQSVHHSRKLAGALVSKVAPVDADVVIGSPDSGLEAAMGYAEASGIPYGVGLMKNRYIGRTFIQPTQKERENSVKIKLNAIERTVKGKRVILVDDSIVRGTTSKRVVKILREAGAKEVHMRVASPPYTNKCYFGTDNTEKRNLIAARTNVEGIREELGLDSIAFLPLEEMLKVAPDANCGFCIGCFTGEYPVDITKANEVDKFNEKIGIY